MNKILMVAAMKYSESDGISKKICMQAGSLSSKERESILLCLGNDGVLQHRYIDDKLISSELNGKYLITNNILPEAGQIEDLLRSTLQLINTYDFDMLYIRHMLPCFSLIKVLAICKKKKIKIAYEIPTFPYYKEQLSISRNKIKTLIKLSLETLFWPFIYVNIDKLLVVRCNSKSIHLKKMEDIYNGYSGEKNTILLKPTENLNMIGVGTIYPYHGYRRIIMAMKNCNSRLKNQNNIRFHIVGESAEIDELKKLVLENNMGSNVIFYGKKYGDELKEIYDECNVGIGTLLLSLRSADIDTAIKNIEYLSFYMPVITSGKVFDIPADSGLIYEQSENSDINFDEIVSFVERFYQDKDSINKIDSILKQFEWKTIMDKVVRCTLNVR